MQYAVSLQSTGDEYVAECASLGLRASGLSATSALDRLRDSIRFSLEFCPCSTLGEGEIELEIRGG